MLGVQFEFPVHRDRTADVMPQELVHPPWLKS